MKPQNNAAVVKKYQLNEHQWFVINQSELSNDLDQIKYPALILDTEFFNHSHHIDKNLEPLYSEQNKSIVYVIDYAILKNKADLAAPNKEKLIRNLRLRRRLDETPYDFDRHYQQLIQQFSRLLVKNQIASIIVAGASNDRAILENWLQQNKSYFSKRSAPVVIPPKPSLNMVDVYTILEKDMAFANFKADGEPFWPQQNLKPGFYDQEVRQLPSLKKFFEYMSQAYPDFAHEDNADIYHLSQKALTFFTLPKFVNSGQYYHLNRAVREAERHCFNDVYKLWELLSFWSDCLNYRWPNQSEVIKPITNTKKFTKVASPTKAKHQLVKTIKPKKESK